MSNKYTEADIYTPTGLEYVALRPTAFFDSTGMEGLLHQALEIITNAIDELALMPAHLCRLLVMLCIDAENNTYQLVVKDNGRGLPLGKLLDSFTKMDTSGKFNTNAYEHSGGLYGKGAKAVAGSATHLKAISHRPEGSAAIYVHKRKIDTTVERLNVPPEHTGVTVIYEPDPTVLTDISLFGEVGQEKLITLFQKLCFFHKLNVEFRVYPLGLPARIWKSKLTRIEEIVAKYAQAARPVFNEESFDRTQWLRNYFGITRPFSSQLTISDHFTATNPMDPTREVNGRYEVRIYTVKFDTVGGRFGMINNLAIDDAKSTHLLSVSDAVKVAMGTHIKDNPVRKFFLEQYRVPLFIAVDVKYPGAEPSGTTKSAFISKAFRNVYEPSLQRQLSTPEGSAFVANLYRDLADDIESRYLLEVTGVVKTKNMNRLFEQFTDISKRFIPCSTTDRMSAELFLVEGNSAGGGAEGRDSKTQAIYMLQGKPFNGVYSRDEVRQSAIDISRDEIYKEILAVTGINPAKFDRNSLDYARINIFTDADSHGRHISAILVGNFLALNPDIVSSGILHIVVPPLYSLELAGRKQKSERIYFRDETALRLWMIEKVYMKFLDVGVRFKGYEKKPYHLKDKSCVNFLRLVLAIGDAINNLSEELVLDPGVIERLTHVIGYIEEGKVDEEKIRQRLVGPDYLVDRVSYNKDNNLLVLTIGKDDHIIPLQNVQKRLIDLVLPLMNRIRWRTTQIYITTKNTSEFKDQPVSIMKLCDIMKTLDGMFRPYRYKGIGSMKPEDKGRTCMDPKSRNIFRITSVGDVDRIFELLGDDALYRKRLLGNDD